MSRSPFASEIGLLAVVLIWGVNFAVIKVPLEVAEPFVVNLLRFVVSLAVLGALHVRQSQHRGTSPLATFEIGRWRVVGIGLLGIAVYQVGFILGVDRVTAGMGALLIASSPMWTVLTGHLMGIDRLRPLGWAGILLGLLGVALVTLGRPEAELGGDASGIGLMLLAALAWGLYTTLTRPLLDRGASPVGLTFWGIVISFPVLVALALPHLAATDWDRLGAWEWASIVFSGGLSTGIAYGIWNAAVKAVGPSKTAAFSNLVPFVGLGAGALLLSEPIRALQVVGGLLIVAGVVVTRRLG
ncbi:MAG: DMT family transporter [Bacteroidota bacterium]